MREKIIKGGTAVILRQLVSLPINAFGVSLASRLLSPRDFGVQAILTPVITLTMLLIDLGTSQALVQREASLSSALLRRVQLLKSTCAVLTIGVLTLLAPLSAQRLGLSRNLILLFPVCGLLGWLQSQRSLQAVGLQRKVDWGALARIEMLEIVAYNIVLVVTAFWLRSAWCFAAALGMRYGFGAVLLRVKSPVLGSLPSPLINADLKPLLRFGFPLQATNMFAILNGLVNPVVVGGLISLHAVGIVSWSAYIVSLPMLPLQPLPNFLFSVLAERRRQKQHDQDVLAGFTFIGTMFVAFLALLVTLSLEWLVQHVFGKQWAEALPVVAVMMLAIIFQFPTQVLVAHLTANGHSAAWLLANIFSTAVLWGVAALAVSQLGAIGYAIGWVASWFVQLVLLSAMARRLTRFKYRWSNGVYLVIAYCLTIAVVYWLRPSLNSVAGGSVLKIIGGGLMFVLVLMPLVLLRKPQWQAVIRLFFPLPSSRLNSKPV